MNNHIQVIENFLSQEECDFILNKYKNELILSEAQVANGDYKSRKSSVGWIDELNGVNNRLTDLLKTSYNIRGIEVTGLGPFQFTEYKVGEYFDWHSDRSREYYRDRFVSIVIQLNDNYSGGIFEIKDIKNNLIPIKQNAGNLFMFDSGLKHRVTPVMGGIRYSLVNWVSLVKTDSKKQNLL
jgi:PKHD-type hydroxylase